MIQRRRILGGFLSAAALTMARPALARPADLAAERRLALRNLHTGEAFAAPYWAEGAYLPESLQRISWVLRDHRDNQSYPMQPELIDLLHSLSAKLGVLPKFDVISGYRSPHTNAQLAAHSDGVVTNSLHTRGMAIDIRMEKVDLGRLRDAARSLGSGGVGYYPRSDFVHVDTGRVRYW